MGEGRGAKPAGSHSRGGSGRELWFGLRGRAVEPGGVSEQEGLTLERPAWGSSVRCDGVSAAGEEMRPPIVGRAGVTAVVGPL